MTRKDFILIADEIGRFFHRKRTSQLLMRAKSNPRFNRDKFLGRTIKAWEDKHLVSIDDEIPY